MDDLTKARIAKQREAAFRWMLARAAASPEQADGITSGRAATVPISVALAAIEMVIDSKMIDSSATANDRG